MAPDPVVQLSLFRPICPLRLLRQCHIAALIRADGEMAPVSAKDRGMETVAVKDAGEAAIVHAAAVAAAVALASLD